MLINLDYWSTIFSSVEMFNRFAPMKSIVLFIAIVDSRLCKTYLVETKDSYGVTSPNQTLGEETDFYDPLTLVNIHNILILTRKICLFETFSRESTMFF